MHSVDRDRKVLQSFDHEKTSIAPPYTLREVVKCNDDLITKRAEEDGDVVDTKIIRYTDDLTTK